MTVLAEGVPRTVMDPTRSPVLVMTAKSASRALMLETLSPSLVSRPNTAPSAFNEATPEAWLVRVLKIDPLTSIVPPVAPEKFHRSANAAPAAWMSDWVEALYAPLNVPWLRSTDRPEPLNRPW